MKNTSISGSVMPAGRLIKLLMIALFVFSGSVSATAQVGTEKNERIQKAENKYKQLFAQEITESKTDPELLSILQRLIFGDTFFVGKMDDKTRELLTITALTTNQTLPQLKSHTKTYL